MTNSKHSAGYIMKNPIGPTSNVTMVLSLDENSNRVIFELTELDPPWCIFLSTVNAELDMISRQTNKKLVR